MEEKADYVWFPNTKNNGKEFDAEEIVNKSAQFINHRGAKYCGIYFLIDCDEIVYVGQSVDIKSRLQQHSDNIKLEKNFNRFFFVLCDKSELNKLEAYYILKFRPKYNIAIPKEEL